MRGLSKKYLLSKSDRPGPYHLYLHFIDMQKHGMLSELPGFKHHLLQSIDIDIAYRGSDELMIYSKLGRIIAITQIAGNQDAWTDGLVYIGSGKVQIEQNIRRELIDWWISRTLLINARLEKYPRPKKSNP